MQSPIKIGFVLLSNSQDAIPSTRIVVLNMLPYLRMAQFDPQIVFEPGTSTSTPDLAGIAANLKNQGFDVIFFQKVFGDSVLALAHELRILGIKTVFSICDFVNPLMCAATDMTIVVTDYLKELYPIELQSKIVVIHDGIERPDVQITSRGSHSGSRARPLQAVLVTSASLARLPLLVTPPSWLTVTIVGAYAPSNAKLQRLRENWWELSRLDGVAARLKYLRFLHNSRIFCKAWGPSSVYNELLQADIGIIPVEVDPRRDPDEFWKNKSENRLTLKMAMGLPVIATPIPSYEPVIEQGKNGFLAHDSSEWLRYLTLLRDPQLRQSIGLQARKTAMTRYSMDLQAAKLIAALRALVA